MSYKLLIVESPTKVTSLNKYLKSEGNYKIASSMGHIRDLPSKKGMNIDIENDFKPNYQIKTDKRKVIKELKSLAKDAQEVIMASDGDREGEAIAWHLCYALKLDPKTTKRIIFHEITAPALKKALEKPLYINQNLVDAQQARRILDRIVGFELSPILWQKMQKPGLSAGRVQSVAVRLIYEREKAISEFEPKIEITGQGIFNIKGQEITADLKNPLETLEEGQEFLKSSEKATFKIEKCEVKPSLRKPGPPFKTSTLQQEASRRLRFSIKQTMQAAQQLYEKGYITYMRTDSLNLSQQSLKAAEKYISQTFGQKRYHHKRTYQTQSKGAQEAHEAIRPTDFTVTQATDVDLPATKLYQLIWQKTLASQMAPAKIDRTTIHITSNQSEHQLIVKGHTLCFDGFLKVTQDMQDDVILPEVQPGEKLQLKEMKIFEKFSQPPVRFSEATLVKTLEELGIGRPSTYAPTISTILDRGYVIKGHVEPRLRIIKGFILKENQIKDYEIEEKWGGSTNKLIPEDLTQLVIPFLIEYFQEIMNYDFTSKIETDLDKIALDQLDWTTFLKTFYQKFHPLIQTAKEADRKKIQKMKEIGIDPADQKTIYARWGKYGPMLQKGLAEDSDEKPIMTNLPPDTTLETVTLKEAMKMFQLPRLVGQTEQGGEIKSKIGPYGPYLTVEEEGQKFNISLKDHDPFLITKNEALELIQTYKENKEKANIADFGEIKIINGRFGPYITDGTKNCKIPNKDKDGQDIDPHKVTKEQASKWLKEKGKTRKSRPKIRS